MRGMAQDDRAAAGPSSDPACRAPDLSTVCTPCHEGKGRLVKMIPGHAHYQCPECGWRDSCCM